MLHGNVAAKRNDAENFGIFVLQHSVLFLSLFIFLFLLFFLNTCRFRSYSPTLCSFASLFLPLPRSPPPLPYWSSMFLFTFQTCSPAPTTSRSLFSDRNIRVFFCFIKFVCLSHIWSRTVKTGSSALLLPEELCNTSTHEHKAHWRCTWRCFDLCHVQSVYK